MRSRIWQQRDNYWSRRYKVFLMHQNDCYHCRDFPEISSRECTSLSLLCCLHLWGTSVYEVFTITCIAGNFSLNKPSLLHLTARDLVFSLFFVATFSALLFFPFFSFLDLLKRKLPDRRSTHWFYLLKCHETSFHSKCCQCRTST